MLKIKLEKAKNNFFKKILHQVQKSGRLSDPLKESSISELTISKKNMAKKNMAKKINMTVKNKKTQTQTKKKLAKTAKVQAVNKKKSVAKVKSNVKVAAKNSNKNKQKISPAKVTKAKNAVKKVVKTIAKVATKKQQKQKIQNAKNSSKETSKIKIKQSSQKSVQKKISEKVQDNKVLDIKFAIEKKKTFEQRVNEKKFVESGKKSGKNLSFKINDSAVYPSHGVGKIVDVENTNIGGQDFSCYLMYFETEKLTIKIPVSQSHRVGLRALSTKDQMEEVFAILRSGVKKLKGMWSRRAQEYEAKINSGDIMMLAEVLRDLTRDIEDGERSYSERIIYETAIYRLSAEYAAIYGISFEEGREKVLAIAKDKLGSFDNKVKAKEDDFDFDDEVESSEEEEDDLLEDSDENDYDDDDSNTSGKRSVRG